MHFLDYRDWDQKKGGTDFGGRSVSVNPDSLFYFMTSQKIRFISI